MTETARLADYVLPAASQYEKPEATFFNLEFPRNTFHLRHPLLEPLPGTLPEPEIWARLIRALGVVDEAQLAAAARGRARGPPGLRAGADGGNRGATRRSARLLPYVLYETLGPTLPDGLQGAAALWGLAQRCAMTYPTRCAAPGTRTETRCSTRSSRAVPASPSRSTSTRTTSATSPMADKRIALEIPEMLEELHALVDKQPGFATDDFPIVLSVGERRSYTANDIFRDPSWRKRDADGALRVSAEDARAPRPRRRRAGRASRPHAAAPRRPWR